MLNKTITGQFTTRKEKQLLIVSYSMESYMRKLTCNITVQNDKVLANTDN